MHVYSYVEKGCRKKCTRQSRKVLRVVLNSSFFKEVWNNGTRGHGRTFASAERKATKVGSTAAVSWIVWIVYWSHPILPFGIVACTFFPTTFLEIVYRISDWFFENKHHESCSHLSEKRVKSRFFAPNKLENRTCQGKGKGERKERKREKGGKEQKKQWLRTLSSYNGYFENCLMEEGHLAVPFSKIRLDIYCTYTYYMYTEMERVFEHWNRRLQW